jgi:ferric iron reductase protein FhuF
MTVRLGGGAVPLVFHIGHEGTAQPGTETAVRFGPLIDDHLAPLFAALTRQVRVAPKILWGNLARRLDGIFDQALQLTGGAPPIARDRDHLLHAPLWHDGRPNPMHRPQRSVIRIHSDMPLTLHRQCCLFYLLPGQGYCSACPLAPQFQQARRKLSAAAPSS